MQVMSVPVGIAFGTTNSAVAMVNPVTGEIVVHRDPTTRSETTPSCVWKDPKSGEIVVGRRAFRRVGARRAPIRSIRRLLGTQRTVTLTDSEATPEEVSAYILAEMKRQIETVAESLSTATTRYVVDRVIVTVPAYFDQPQINATRRAAELAGLEVLDLLQDPVAAAVQYGWQTGFQNGVLLVYDLGGSSFNASVLRCTAGVFEVLGIGGRNILGGDDLDAALARELQERLIREEYVLDLDLQNSEHDRLLFEHLKFLAEGVKKALSTGHEYVLHDTSMRDQNGSPLVIEAQFERTDVEALWRPIVERTIPYCFEALEKARGHAGVTIADVDAIVLAGGSTHIPMVREMVRQNLCTDTGDTDLVVDPRAAEGRAKCDAPTYEKVDTIIALGAAIRAAAVGGQRSFVFPPLTLAPLEPAPGDVAEPLPVQEGVDLIRVPTDQIFPHRPEVSPDDAAAVQRYFLPSDFELISGAVLMHLSANSSSSPTVGSLKIPDVLGRYEIMGLLGQGAFTSVYLARDVDSAVGRKVALKIPLHQHVSDRWLAEILREAKIWRALSVGRHANILSLDDVQRAGRLTFFVMEYMEGRDLATSLQRSVAQLPVGEALRLIEQICAGLAFGHSQHVIHGDIKPQNILVSVDRAEVKISDFGLATFMSDRSGREDSERAAFGTAMFLAPESFEGHVSTRTDIYALGVTMYFIFTKQYPFTFNPHSSTKYDDLRLQKLAFKSNLRHLRSDVSLWLDNIISTCLSPDQDKRFASVSDLKKRLSYHTEPRKRQRITLMAWSNPESQTVDYDLDIEGSRSRELLTIDVNHQTIEGICRQWDLLGDLALERAAYVYSGSSTTWIDSEIRSTLVRISEDGAHFLLGPRVRALLADAKPNTLWLLHDPRMTAIPWELLGINGSYLCRAFDVTRWPRLIRGSYQDAGVPDDAAIRVLIIADPAGDLPGARDEAEQLRRVLHASALAERLIVEVLGPDVDSFTLRSKMRHCHILHFAGHGIFSESEGDLSAGGWLLKSDPANPERADLLSARALEDFWAGHGPLLVFANACFSGRSSAGVWQKRPDRDAAMGLGQAFLSAGVANYIGSVWAPPDTEATVSFAVTFYEHFLDGLPIGESLRAAREHAAREFGEEDLTWARYVLMGDPLTHISL